MRDNDNLKIANGAKVLNTVTTFIDALNHTGANKSAVHAILRICLIPEYLVANIW